MPADARMILLFLFSFKYCEGEKNSMANAAGIGAGVFLIILSLVFYFTALPSLVQGTDTTAGHSLENLSDTNKQIVGGYQFVFAVLPYMMFGIGLVLAAKGAT